jgi:predicted transcriptional regulator of viral defense system
VNQSRLDQLIPEIEAWFSLQTPKVYTRGDLDSLLDEKRIVWKIPGYVQIGRFVKFLLSRTHLKEVEAVSVGTRRLPTTIRYVWGVADVFMFGLSLRNESYLSHSTAVFLHGLSDQNPFVIFNSKAQRSERTNKSVLTQAAIDAAFSKRQRESHRIYQSFGMRFTLLDSNPLHASDVVTQAHGGAFLKITSMERTLIDICVRPAYAGGVIQVLETFRRARKLDVSRLFASLQKSHFAYPYQQAIGFYLQRAGASVEELEPFKLAVTKHNFYLGHSLLETDYLPEWKLYVPRGFK